MNKAQKFAAACQRNSGYWDGVSDSERNKQPVWAKSYQYKPAHPFDRHYGAGYWAGRYGESHPNTAA